VTVKGLVAEWLKAHGYEGLVRDTYGDPCGCGLDGLMPCEGCDVANCEPAYEHLCDTCPKAEEDCLVEDMPEMGGRCWGVEPFAPKAQP
jgi:hypothetical protein